MNLKKTFALAAASVAAISGVWAEAPGWTTKAPYTESFANATVSGSKFTKLADYWEVKGEGAVWAVSSGVIGTTQNLIENTTDYLITPQVKGAVTVQAKYCYWGARTYANLSVYKCTLEEGVYTIGEQVLNQSLEEVSSMTTYTIAAEAADYSYYAIHVSGAYIDNFSATSAYVNVPVDKQFLPTAVTSDWTDSNPIFADAEGKATWTGKVKVKNTGNVDLTAGEENFSLAVASQSTYAVTTTTTTFAIPSDLAVGEEKEFDVELPIALASANDGRTAIRFTTNLLPKGTTATASTNYKQSSWFTLKTQAPKLYVKNADNSDVANYATSLGLVAAPASTTFTLKNDGGSPVVLKSISSSFVNAEWKDGEDALAFPLNIAKGDSKVLTLILNNPGGQESTLTFTYGNTYNDDEYTVVSKAVSAVVSDPSLYLENFTSYLTVPTDWCQPGWVNQPGSNWKFNSSSSNTYAENSVQQVPEAYLITPMITFTEGQTLTVSAVPGSTYASYDCFIRVLYSADRKTWNTANIIATSASKASVGDDADKLIEWGSFSGTAISYAKAFVISGIPAGDWYIGFQSGYSKIDYIFGGVQKVLEHDVYVNSFEAPTKATVNYPVTVNFAYSNMIDVNEAAYTVAFFDGETPLKSVEGTNLAAFASANTEYTFTPHAVGTMHLQAKITVGEATFASDVVDVTVAQEVATLDKLVGERTNSTGAYAPFGLNYNNSKSEFIYKADMIGLEAGTQIASISFPYYNTSKDIDAQVKIYVENTEDETLSAFTADTTQMTCVYANASHRFTMGGSSSEHALMTFELEAPFTYTGKNLRFVCVSENGKTYSNYYFEYVNSTGSCWCKRVDNFSAYQTNAGFASSNLPVCYFGYTIETPTVSGVVKNGATGAAIEGATVRFADGEVYYESTTNAQGEYSVTLMQPSREYQITATPVPADLYQYPVAPKAFAADATVNVILPNVKYERDVTADNFGTLCLPNAVPAGYVQGATLYNVAGVIKTADVIDMVVFAEAGAVEAGQPVVFQADAAKLTVYGVGAAASAPVAATGLVGNFAETSVSTEGMYILSNNQIRKLAGGTASLAANRAYFDLSAVADYAASANEEHVVFIDVEEEGAANGINEVAAEANAEVYDLTGRRVNAATKGLFINNGKKIVVK